MSFLRPQFILIIGPMCAGKSTELLRRIKQLKILNKQVLAVNHSSDIRYGPASEINTHAGETLKDCISINKLCDLITEEGYQNAHVIAIDELQFFEDSLPFIEKAVDVDRKIVIASGLKGDFKRRPFKSIVDVIPHAESIIELKSLCKRCGDGTEAPFTKKIVKSDDNVGGMEMYEPLCRLHFIQDDE